MYQHSLSIIIPVYNVDSYIAIFLESLLPQLNDEIECIFINDGTLDNSINILNQYIKKFPSAKIKVIDQFNQGQSVARNNGLTKASGKYIGFLDPDDYVEKNYISSILTAMKTYDFDILHFNAIKINNKNLKENLRLVDQSSLLEIDDAYLEKIFAKKLWFPWLRIIRSSLLSEFNFPPNCIMEDMLAFPFIYKKAKQVYELEEYLVVYQYRQNSSMNSKISMRLINSLDFGIQTFRPFSEDKHLGFLYRSFIVESLFKKSKLNYDIFHSSITNYHEDINIVKHHLDEVHWKKRILINHPKFFFFYHRISDLLKGRKH